MTNSSMKKLMTVRVSICSLSDGAGYPSLFPSFFESMPEAKKEKNVL